MASSGTSFLTPTTAVPAQSSTTGEPDAKRIKVAKPKPATPLVAIRCVSCQQTDVPLILGGRKSSSILVFPFTNSFPLTCRILSSVR